MAKHLEPVSVPSVAPGTGAAGGRGGGRADMPRGNRFTKEARLRGQATIQAQADAFARNMAGTIAELEREGISSATAMAKALNERAVATARGGRWAAITVILLRRRLKRLGLTSLATTTIAAGGRLAMD